MIDVKKFVETLDGRPVAVLGLGISNGAAIAALEKAGASVAAWDDDAARRTGASIKDLAQEDLSAYGCLVMAPGVPLSHPVAVKARAAEIDVICDLEILHRCSHGRRMIGITGTNGKSTTTALIGHILKECGVKAPVGGNIGKAALALALPPKDGVFVLEISSFQADLCPTFAPDITVHLNLTPDHMDRHGTMEAYAASKTRLFRGPGKAVIGIDDEPSRKILKAVQDAGERECFSISVSGPVKSGVYVENGVLFDAMDGGDSVSVAPLGMAALPGVHNHQNAAAAYAAARLTGLAPDAIIAGMKSFPGLPHRQYLVRAINGVAYINDSKATNAAATARALACYKTIYWIAGGRAKEGGLSGLEPYAANIRHAFLIGEAMDDFAQWLDNHGVTHHFCATLDVAVAEAHRAAQSERGQPGGAGAVLLSPACASFDQFRNFEERGDVFTTLVEGLEENP